MDIYKTALLAFFPCPPVMPLSRHVEATATLSGGSFSHQCNPLFSQYVPWSSDTVLSSKREEQG